MTLRTIDIWTFPLEASDSDAAALAALLSRDERERADRFVRPLDALHFRVARGRMREILARTSGVEPKSLMFDYGAHGKPFIAAPALHLDFNLSHSDALAVLAVSTGGAVGIDIERIRPLEEGELEGYFSPRERDALGRLAGSERLHAFYRCWTRKEAIVKAHGAGLEIPLDAFDVPIDGDDTVLVDGFAAGSDEPAPRWRVVSFVPAAGFAGAVAVACGPSDDTEIRWLTRPQAA